MRRSPRSRCTSPRPPEPSAGQSVNQRGGELVTGRIAFAMKITRTELGRDQMSSPRPTWRARLTSALGEHLSPESRETFGREGGEGGIRTLDAPFGHARDFQSRSFGRLGHLSARIQSSAGRGDRSGVADGGVTVGSPVLEKRGPADLGRQGLRDRALGRAEPRPLGPGGGRPSAWYRALSERSASLSEPSDDAQDVRELVRPDRLAGPCVERLPTRVVRELPERSLVPRDEDPDRALGSLAGRGRRHGVGLREAGEAERPCAARDHGLEIEVPVRDVERHQAVRAQLAEVQLDRLAA